MRLGIFAKTIDRPTLGGALEVIGRYGLREVHFNLACAGSETLPVELTSDCCRAIRASFGRHDLTMCGVSGTFNAIHPDKAFRAESTRRACSLIDHCSDLGTSLVSLCTGSRNPSDMWADHPANREPSAWNDLCITLDELLRSAQRNDVILGIEPEQSNVINSAALARRLLDQFHSHNLKIVLDAANLFHAGNLPQMRYVLDEALELLRGDIVMAHAKDVPRQPGGTSAAGSGLLDWKHYLQRLHESGFDGPLVMHNLSEAQIPASLSFLEGQLALLEAASETC